MGQVMGSDPPSMERKLERAGQILGASHGTGAQAGLIPEQSRRLTAQQDCGHLRRSDRGPPLIENLLRGFTCYLRLA